MNNNKNKNKNKVNSRFQYKHRMLLLQALVKRYQKTYNVNKKKIILDDIKELKLSLKDLRKVIVNESISICKSNEQIVCQNNEHSK